MKNKDTALSPARALAMPDPSKAVSDDPASRARERELTQRRELPMLFSDAMVRAILAGSKTQTRRVTGLGSEVYPLPVRHARYRKGDRIWVRECWCQYDRADRNCVVYRADCTKSELDEARAVRREVGGRAHAPWRPSIFMPRWASRITLQVTEVRVQRLQEISDADIAAEGVTAYVGETRINGAQATTCMCAARMFAELWNSINGKRTGYSWADNPWVWAITFDRLTPTMLANLVQPSTRPR